MLLFLLFSFVNEGLDGRKPGLAAIVTLASSLDYTSSKSVLKLLVPLVSWNNVFELFFSFNCCYLLLLIILELFTLLQADPAQILNVPVIPLGTLVAAAYPLTSRAPYALSWLNEMISSTDMMHPDHMKKLVGSSFCKYWHEYKNSFMI